MSDHDIRIRVTADTSGVNRLAEAFAAARQQANRLTEGAAQGAERIGGGLHSAGQQANRLAEGFAEARQQANRLTEGAAQGAERIGGGLHSAGQQANRLSEGFAEARQQANRLSEGAAQGAERIGGGLHSAGAASFQLADGFKAAGAALLGMVAVDKLQDIAKFTLDAYRETEKFSAVLKTATGSVDAANVKLAELRKFAAETPYDLAQAVDGFVKLKNMGLDPSISSLRSYGNTAAAMGKELNQMIEAVADAATSEFERLKEFGIKAKQEGDTVKFTFQGVTTEIKNDSESIQRYLLAIGNTKFSAAMQDQANTLNGILSSLSDNAKAVAANWLEQSKSADILKAALSGLDAKLKEINNAQQLLIESPADLTAAIDNGKSNAAISQIKNLTTEFKSASQERRVAIRNELLDFYEVLRKKQTEHRQALLNAQKWVNTPAGGLAKVSIESDARLLGDTSVVMQAVENVVRDTASILNPAYWDKLEGAQKPFWESIEKGSYTAATASKDTAATVAASIAQHADWLKPLDRYKPTLDKYQDEIKAAADQFGNLNENMIKAVMIQESLVAAKNRNVSPETISSGAGAVGLMQLMPGTFHEQTQKLGMTGASIYNAADNIKAGAGYLSRMLAATGGDFEKALAAYNAGLGKVQKYNGVPPYKETQTYVRNVMAYYKQLTGDVKKEEDQQVKDTESAVKRQEEIAKLSLDAASSAKLASIDKEELLTRSVEIKTVEGYQQQLDQVKAFEDRRYAIKLEALQKQKALFETAKNEKDKDGNPTDRAKQADVDIAKVNAQIEQLATDHSLKLLEIEQQTSAKLSEMRKQEAEKQREIDTLTAKHREAMALEQLDRMEQVAQQQLQAGMITNAEMLQLEQQFENRRYQIRLQSLQQQAVLAAKDPSRSVVAAAQLNMQLEQLEQQHQIKLAAIRTKALMQNRQHITDMVKGAASGIQQSIAGVLSFTTSLSDGIRGVFQSILSSVANVLAQIAVEWGANKLLIMIGSKQTAMGQIGANAATAGSAAFASTAAIPVVGPALAPAAAAAAYTGALSFMGAIPAAAKGYDIPAGVNPLTQLHEKEMVLPAHLAENVRNMTASGGDNINISVTGMDIVTAVIQSPIAGLLEGIQGIFHSIRSGIDGVFGTGVNISGPVLTPVAAAYTGVLSYGDKIPAAAKGYDIPAGVNPLTQLHEKEMVLPAHLAENVRNMTASGGDTINININAMDSRDVRRLFQNEGGSLVDSLRKQMRNFKGLSG